MTSEQRSLYDPASYERDVFQDAWSWGERLYWRRRAEQLEAARPRPGDFNGRATPDQLAQRSQRLAEAAAACMHRGDFIELSLAHLEDVLLDLNHPGGVA